MQFLNIDTLLFIFFIILMTLFLLKKRKEVAIQKLLWPVIYMIMYRTTFGLKLMDTWAKKYREWIKLLGTISIGIGFAGMVWVTYEIIKVTVSFLHAPKTVETGVALVLPGVTIPGLGKLSFFHWLLALTILVIVHEFSHGVVARAFNLKIKSSGFAFLSLIVPIIPAAFVEPDEKEIVKQPHTTQNAIYAAGPISNGILTIIALLCTTLLLFPLHSAISHESGSSFDIINDTLPASLGGLQSGMIIIGINDQQINNSNDLINSLNNYHPGDTLLIKTKEGKSFSIIPQAHPDNAEKAFIGINNIKTEYQAKAGFQYFLPVLDWTIGLFFWIATLSFIIGLINLYPIFITDGGRMVHATLLGIMQDRTKAIKTSFFINVVCTLSFLLLLVGSLVQWTGLL